MRFFDYKKLETRTWDKEILNYVGNIHEFRGRQQLFIEQKPEELNRLVELAKIQSTEASNEIEGIRTTNARLHQLMNDKITPKNRDEKEILGYRYALKLIHENYEYIPIRPNFILQLHKEMYQFMDVNYGGKFKDVPNEIAAHYPDGHKEVIFKPLEPFETPAAVESLCNEYNKAISSGTVDPLVAIPVFIHDFLCIHPFNDGNGRMSRLLTTLLLYRSGYMVGKYISLEKKIQITKDEYYDALEKSSKSWHEEANNDTAFVKYLLGVILASYRDFEERIRLTMTTKKLSAKEMVEVAINKKIGKLTKSDIMELCPAIARSSIEKALKELCEEGKLIKHGGGRSTFYSHKS
ncbi:MAG: Fic family protein [Anaeroplasmataceae bacterium]|nr:Fic family protein [Anaeroplasmataceae bacterium]